VPVVLFPGSNLYIHSDADGILFLSLISGRNPEFLIGQHVVAAPLLKASGLEILPTGYMLVDGGKPTTVSYISNTQPIPADKADIAACTAMAGEMLGQQLLYLDAGSGAENPVSPGMISAVKKATSLPLLAGGGIRSGEQARNAWEAGADCIVIGNVLESNPGLLEDFIRIRDSF
jgi:putative glycerol-1-phosphate prenyltransferase